MLLFPCPHIFFSQLSAYADLMAAIVSAANLTPDPCIDSEKILTLLQVLNFSRLLSGIGFTNAEETPNTRAKIVFEKNRLVPFSEDQFQWDLVF